MKGCTKYLWEGDTLCGEGPCIMVSTLFSAGEMEETR